MSPGEQIIDISFIDDVIEAFFILSRQLHNGHTTIKNGEIFGVKAVNRYSLKELAVSFEELIGKKLNIQWGKRSYRDREVMIPWENVKVVPGWRPKFPLTEALHRLYK
jgi:nucleoside-diphosphate-sugar epimerase